ncbi:transposase [Ligilactobacillus sp. LYQ60]|uniref:transposase n=1 Tax=unclassified Ligilactobacillus TaxID=2767920 RepID=UPI003854479B
MPLKIIASFKCQLSSGLVKGINNKTKVIKRVAYSYWTLIISTSGSSYSTVTNILGSAT